MNFAFDQQRPSQSQPFNMNATANLFGNTQSQSIMPIASAIPSTGPTSNRNLSNQFQPNYNVQMPFNNGTTVNNVQQVNGLNNMNILMTNQTQNNRNDKKDPSKQIQLSAQEINDFLS